MEAECKTRGAKRKTENVREPYFNGNLEFAGDFEISLCDRTWALALSASPLGSAESARNRGSDLSSIYFAPQNAKVPINKLLRRRQMVVCELERCVKRQQRSRRSLPAIKPCYWPDAEHIDDQKHEHHISQSPPLLSCPSALSGSSSTRRSSTVPRSPAYTNMQHVSRITEHFLNSGPTI